MTVALDARPPDTYQFIDAAGDDRVHLALIDTAHLTGPALGFWNVPMAVWVDEDGTIVRPAELASVEATRLPSSSVPADQLPPRLRRTMEEVAKMPRVDADRYRAAIADFAELGRRSRFVLAPDEVGRAAGTVDADAARAAACFELGQHLLATEGHDAAIPWWREAHRLQPRNWTYKRQAWSIALTPPDAPANELLQGPNDAYEGNWIDDVVALGGGEAYYPQPTLPD